MGILGLESNFQIELKRLIMTKNKKNHDKDVKNNSEVKEEIEKPKAKSDRNAEEVDYKSKFMRVSADFLNFKKRTEKEQNNWGYISQAEVILKFLPFVDDLDRAIKAGEKMDIDEEKKESWLNGFKIIEKKLNKIFDDLQIKQIDCSGLFDPEYHEALLQVESKDKKTGEIVDVVHKGYMFKDKVLQHAKVVVAK